MNPKPLLIPRRVLLPAGIISLVLVLVGAWLKITHFTADPFTGNALMAIAVIVYFVLFIVILTDMIRNRIRNPFMWFVAVFFLGLLGNVLYLYWRERIVLKQI